MAIENRLPRCAPEAQGVSSSAIHGFVEAVEKQISELHSFMLLRHGAVVAEGWWSPYGPDRPHMLFSLSKSFTSTAIGLAVAEGRLSVEDRVLSFFPDDAPARISRNLDAMQVRHLLSMSTGHAEDTTGYMHKRRDGNWIRAFLARPVQHKPGTFFLYNTGATYMLSAIIQKVTGLTLLDYLQPRLFEPLGIQNPTWEMSPQGINTGGYGLSITTEDYCPLRPDVSPKREVERPTTGAGSVDRSRLHHARFPTAAMKTVIGSRAMATSSGAAATGRTGVMERSDSTALSCPIRRRCLPSRAAWEICSPS